MEPEIITWYHLPEDVISTFFHFLMDENAGLYYIPLMLVNKQSMDLLSKIKIDWLVMLENLKQGFPNSYRPDTPHPSITISPMAIGLIRAVSYNHHRLPIIRNEINDYMKTNNVIYRSKKGNQYKGYIGVKMLAKLTGQSYSYYKLIKKHRSSEIARKKHAQKLKVLFDRSRFEQRGSIPLIHV